MQRQYIFLLFFCIVTVTNPLVCLAQGDDPRWMNSGPGAMDCIHHRDDWELRGTFHAESSSLPDNLNVNFVGHWPFGPAYAVAVKENYVYLASGGGIYVLDISDPYNIETSRDQIDGLGIFDLASKLEKEKVTSQVRVKILADFKIDDLLTGYEIHMGNTEYTAEVKAFSKLTRDNGKEIIDGIG